MAANPIDRVAKSLEEILPSGSQSPHLSGAETPPPFAWGGASPGEPATPQSGKRKTRLACLTSGGDSAGMNAAVRAVVKMAIARSVSLARLGSGTRSTDAARDVVPCALGGLATDSAVLYELTAACPAGLRELYGRRERARTLISAWEGHGPRWRHDHPGSIYGPEQRPAEYEQAR